MTNEQLNPELNKKWYQKPVGVGFLIWIFFPVGLYFMWKEKVYSQKTRIVLTSVLSLFLIIGLTGKKSVTTTADGDSEISSNVSKSTRISESDIAGLYAGRGLYNAGDATINLYYGGSFVMKDPYLPDGGPAYGEWVLDGSSIDFYMEGQRIFSASISRSGNNIRGINLKRQLWKKLR